MTKYMLDTNTVSFAIRGHERVVRHLTALPPRELCVSAVTVAELRYGADKRGSRRLHRLIDTILTAVPVVSFDNGAAALYGRVASLLALGGTPIGMADTLLAAHALSLSVAIVTNNLKHFRLVKGLRAEDWTAS